MLTKIDFLKIVSKNLSKFKNLTKHNTTHSG